MGAGRPLGAARRGAVVGCTAGAGFTHRIESLFIEMCGKEI